VRFLSNGRYRVLLTAAGTGYSAVNDVALTRWRADPVEDADGYFLYLRDLDTRRVWSAGLRPSLVASPRYRARWEPGRFETTRVDEEIESLLEAGAACIPLAHDGHRHLVDVVLGPKESARDIGC
jgi:cyclic beta-1,2-glucan synthetase